MNMINAGWQIRVVIPVFFCVFLIMGGAGVPAYGQFQNLKPTILQPRSTSEVIVPVAPVSGFDFDWSDIPEATHYVLELTRLLSGGGSQVSSVTTTQSKILYSSDTNPLVPGTPAVPNLYSWKVTAYKSAQASKPSDSASFSLMGGTPLVPPKPASGSNPPAPPSNLSPDISIEFTPSIINKNGLLMQWSSVPNTSGSEIQLVRAKDEDGNIVDNLHYRMDVTGLSALVSNITLFGEYRFELRSISSLGVRSSAESVGRFKVVNYVAADIYPDPPFPDGRVDEFDLFTLARNWFHFRNINPKAPNKQADIVNSDGMVEQSDLAALLIQYRELPMEFPQGRVTPTPAPLAPPQLNLPNNGESFTLNSPGQTIAFSWAPVENAQTYNLFIRNVSESEQDFFSTSETEFQVPGSTFLSNLAGNGNYTWEVFADAPGFIQSQSVQRTFTLNLTFNKTGKVSVPSPLAPFHWRNVFTESLAFLWGSAAQADDSPPLISKSMREKTLTAKVTVATPLPLFPFDKQCITTLSPFPLVWTEVPGATSYALEISLPGYFFNAVGYVRDQENLNIIQDDLVGDGIVSALFFSTFRSKEYRFRVQARQGNVRGDFSPSRQFEISASCERPYVNIDYSHNGNYEGNDLLVYSGFWFTKRGMLRFNEFADLAPAKLDNFINAKDLLVFIDYFAKRKELPLYPILDAPTLKEPPDAAFYGPDSIGKDFHFTWQPPPAGIENLVVWEMELNLPSSGTTPIAKRFFTNKPEYKTRLSLEGFYTWRVRGITADGYRGDWSVPRSFVIQLDEYQPDLPLMLVPSPTQVLTNGLVEFEWGRVRREKLYAIFDRIEIQNGHGPIIALDIYHRQSEVGQPTVKNKIPLATNYGPQFRWRVRTYFVVQDSFFRLYFNGPVLAPDWQTFTLNTNSPSLSGLTFWDPDLNHDQKVDLYDVARLGKAWYTRQSTDPKFDPGVDFDRNTAIGHEDAILLTEAVRKNRLLQTNGLPAPVPYFPVETAGSNPPVILAQYAQGGIRATWGQNLNLKKYLVEWTDSENRLHGLYADKLATPILISPIGGQLVVIGSSGSLDLTWTSVLNAVQYSVVLSNLTTGRMTVPFVVDATTQGGNTYTLSIPRQELINKLGGVGNYEYRVQPFAPGFFADTSVFETFSVSFAKDGSDYYEMTHPVPGSGEKTKPGIIVEGSGVLPAFSYFGLHSWRVMGLDDNYQITAPSKWNRFGIQCLGPVFGEPLFCGQTPPGP